MFCPYCQKQRWGVTRFDDSEPGVPILVCKICGTVLGHGEPQLPKDFDNWTTKWPRLPGLYWFHGKIGKYSEPKFYLIEIGKMGRMSVWELSHSTSGTMLDRKACLGSWVKADLPKLP